MRVKKLENVTKTIDDRHKLFPFPNKCKKYFPHIFHLHVT